MAQVCLLRMVVTVSDAPPTFLAEQRQRWQRYWLIDPLDGTREFLKRNDEFTVNIALIDAGCPVLGVVHVPVSGSTYVGDELQYVHNSLPGSEKVRQ